MKWERKGETDKLQTSSKELTLGLAVTIKEEGTFLERARLSLSTQGIASPRTEGKRLNFPLDLDFGIQRRDEGCLGQRGLLGKWNISGGLSVADSSANKCSQTHTHVSDVCVSI